MIEASASETQEDRLAMKMEDPPESFEGPLGQGVDSMESGLGKLPRRTM